MAAWWISCLRLKHLSKLGRAHGGLRPCAQVRHVEADLDLVAARAWARGLSRALISLRHHGSHGACVNDADIRAAGAGTWISGRQGQHEPEGSAEHRVPRLHRQRSDVAVHSLKGVALQGCPADQGPRACTSSARLPSPAASVSWCSLSWTRVSMAVLLLRTPAHGQLAAVAR